MKGLGPPEGRGSTIRAARVSGNTLDIMAAKKQDDGEKLPEFIKGKVVHYPYGEYPKVKAGDDVYGYATAHTPTAVIVQWDDGERVHSEWFPARLVHRVTDEDWHGKWMAR